MSEEASRFKIEKLIYVLVTQMQEPEQPNILSRISTPEQITERRIRVLKRVYETDGPSQQIKPLGLCRFNGQQHQTTLPVNQYVKNRVIEEFDSIKNAQIKQSTLILHSEALTKNTQITLNTRIQDQHPQATEKVSPAKSQLVQPSAKKKSLWNQANKSSKEGVQSKGFELFGVPRSVASHDPVSKSNQSNSIDASSTFSFFQRPTQSIQPSVSDNKPLFSYAQIVQSNKFNEQMRPKQEPNKPQLDNQANLKVPASKTNQLVEAKTQAASLFSRPQDSEYFTGPSAIFTLNTSPASMFNNPISTTSPITSSGPALTRDKTLLFANNLSQPDNKPILKPMLREQTYQQPARQQFKSNASIFGDSGKSLAQNNPLASIPNPVKTDANLEMKPLFPMQTTHTDTALSRFEKFPTTKDDKHEMFLKKPTQTLSMPVASKTNIFDVPVKKSIFQQPPKVDNKPIEPSKTITVQPKQTQHNIFSKPSEDKVSGFAQFKTDAHSLFANLSNQQNIFSKPTAPLFGNPQNVPAATSNQTSNKYVFGSSQAVQPPKDNHQSDEDQQGEDDTPIVEEQKIDPKLSTGKYKYETYTETLFKAEANHFKKNDIAEVFRDIHVSLEKILQTGNYNVVIRLPKTNVVSYQGLIVAGKTKVEYINNNHQNVKIIMMMSIENGKPRPDVLKIQFKEAFQGQLFHQKLLQAINK